MLRSKPRIEKAEKIGRTCAIETLEHVDEPFEEVWFPEDRDWEKFDKKMEPYYGEERVAFEEAYMDMLENDRLYQPE